MKDLIINYVPEKDTKNTIRFAPKSEDARLDGSALYINKELVKEFGLSIGFTMTLTANK